MLGFGVAVELSEAAELHELAQEDVDMEARMISPQTLKKGKRNPSAKSARPNPKRAPGAENPLFIGFTALRGGLGPWSQTMVLEGARPWGKG